MNTRLTRITADMLFVVTLCLDSLLTPGPPCAGLGGIGLFFDPQKNRLLREQTKRGAASPGDADILTRTCTCTRRADFARRRPKLFDSLICADDRFVARQYTRLVLRPAAGAAPGCGRASAGSVTVSQRLRSQAALACFSFACAET